MRGRPHHIRLLGMRDLQAAEGGALDKQRLQKGMGWGLTWQGSGTIDMSLVGGGGLEGGVVAYW